MIVLFFFFVFRRGTDDGRGGTFDLRSHNVALCSRLLLEFFYLLLDGETKRVTSYLMATECSFPGSSVIGEAEWSRRRRYDQ